jgi:hypothetical protein
MRSLPVIKRLARFGIVFILALSGDFCRPRPETGPLVLAEYGRSEYRIVITENASLSVRHAAEELQSFLAAMTGAKLPIATDREPLGRKEILLGDNEHLGRAGIDIDIPSLGAEGYHLRTAGSRLVIAGGSRRGALYGVYGLLEDHLGCRWFTPEISRIPKYRKLEIAPLDERKVPVLEYREAFTFDCLDGDWSARNRLNSYGARLESKHGGKVKFGEKAGKWAWFGHTFNLLVPREKYFASHPEYFSLVRGKRLNDPYSQLCCTNEDVIRLCIEAVLEGIKEDPEANVFSVSQNDTYPEAPNYCECETCQALARAEESQAAPVLYLVNRVAEVVEREYPDKLIDTFAYRWTQKPPKSLRPRKNVVIRLCTVHNCFSHPLAVCDSPENRTFRENLEAWSKTGARLWIWDYVNDFQHYLLPFPNLRSRRANIHFYVDNGIKGIFEQDAYDAPYSEMAALGGYLTAKFLWNPDYDENTAIAEFLDAYYGPAAAPVLEYLNTLHDWVGEKGLHVHMWERHPDPCPYFSDDVLIAADRLWRDAESRAAADPAVLFRVRVSRLSVDYAIVERAKCELAGKIPLNEGLKALAKERLGPYFEALAGAGQVRLSEGSPLDIEKYRRESAAGLGISLEK